MPFLPGREKTGGRKKGTPNKKLDILAMCEAKGINPFDTLIDLCKHGQATIRMSAAKELCTYIQPKCFEFDAPGEDRGEDISEQTKQTIIDTIRCELQNKTD